MLGKIFGVLTFSSFVFGALTGRMQQICDCVFDGANEAVELSVSLLGMMCLWNGIVRVLDKAGFTKWLSKLVSPLLRFMYPTAYKAGKSDLIAADIAANILGLGNAALPIGISAMKALSECGLPNEHTASDDMIMFAVHNTAPFQLMPTTLIAMRIAAGSRDPYGIILPIWIVSCATITFGIFLCKALARLSGFGRRSI